MNGEEIADAIKRRLNHPFLSSFIFSFIFYNWKAFIYLTSTSLNSDERIEKITAVTLGLDDIKNYDFFLHPLLVALVLSIGAPLGTSVLNLLTHFVETIQKNLKDTVSYKWDYSHDVNFRNTVDLVSYSQNIVQRLLDGSKNGIFVSSEESTKELMNASAVLSQIKVGNSELLAATAKRLKEQRLI